MKRLTCLSAFVIALSVTSTALADENTQKPAPTTKLAEKPKLVAQNDPNNTNSSGTNPTAAPTNAAPADGSAATPTQPSVTIGATTAPAKDTSQAAAEEPEKKPKPRPFAGTQVFALQSMSTSTVFQGQTQYSDPTLSASAYLSPRYRAADWLQIRGRMVVSYEETNSDTTTYRNEPVLGDAALQFYYMKIPTFGGGFKALLGPYVTLPTSKVSRSRTNIFTPGVTAQISRSFDGILAGGDLWLLGFSYYTHPIYNSNTQTADVPQTQFQCAGGTNCTDLNSGTMNPSDTLAYAAIVGANFGKWSPALEYFGGTQWVYHPKDVSIGDVIPSGGSAPVQSATNNPTAVRQSHYFSAWLDYNWNGWLTTEIGYWQSVNLLAADGKYANPVFSRYAGSQSVYLGVNLNIDEIMKELEGGGGKGGIVRAQNTHKPYFNF